MWEDGYPHAAHTDSAAVGAARGPGSAQEVDPIQSQIRLAEQDPEAAVGVEEHPIVVQQVHGQMQVDTPEGVRLAEREQLLDLVRQQMSDHFAGAEGEP